MNNIFLTIMWKLRDLKCTLMEHNWEERTATYYNGTEIFEFCSCCKASRDKRMKVAYIAHPISGDVDGNLKNIRAIVREINLSEKYVVPFVPYYADIVSMDDSVTAERNRGIKNDIAILESGMVDELRLYGNRISSGMEAEIATAKKMGIPVVNNINQ